MINALMDLVKMNIDRCYRITRSTSHERCKSLFENDCNTLLDKLMRNQLLITCYIMKCLPETRIPLSLQTY